MTEPYVIYNGGDSREIDVIVVKLPDLHRAPENVDLLKVKGRNGRLEQADGTCDTYQDSMKINCNGRTLREVYAWLSGAGWLISSDEPDRRVWVSMHPQAKNSRFRVNEACFDTITVTMHCQPFRYFEPDELPVTVLFSPGEIQNPGTWYSEPVITIRASGDISVLLGQYQMDFEGLTDGIIVDCELQECFTLDRTQLMNAYADIEEFPRLTPGANFIQWSGTGVVESITVERRCRDK